MLFFCLFSSFFFEKSSSFCRENEIFKNKKTKRLDQFLTLEKAKIGPAFNSTIYIYIYVCVCCGFIIWSKFGLLEELLSGPSLLKQRTLFVKKNTENRGFKTFWFTKSCAQKKEGLLSGPSWPFLEKAKLGPDNNPYLDQIVTLQNGIFCFQNVLRCLFWQCFLHQPNVAQKWPNKTITFHILQNTITVHILQNTSY